MDKGQKIRAGLGIRVLILFVFLLAIYVGITMLNSGQKHFDDNDITHLADRKVDRYYLESDEQPLNGFDKPSATESPVAAPQNQ